jgi:hypothetical protein
MLDRQGVATARSTALPLQQCTILSLHEPSTGMQAPGASHSDLHNFQGS